MKRGLVGALAGVAAAVCVFVLPFAVGGHGGAVYSAAYAAGADNRVAAVGLAGIAVAVLVWAFAARVRVDEEDGLRVPAWVMGAGAAVVAAWTVGLGAAVARAGVRYGESAYFLERMRDVGTFGGRLYTDFEWPYGPLLLMPPVWAHRLGMSLVGANFAWLAVLNLAGVLMAAYVLNRLPLERWVRVGLFAGFCFEQMNPLAGANYSLGKFVLPFAVLVWGASPRGGWGRFPQAVPAGEKAVPSASLRDDNKKATARTIPGGKLDWRRFGVFAGGMLLTLLVSPELGVGLGAGIMGWAAVRAWQRRQFSEVVYAAAPVVGEAVFLAMYGRGFLERLGHAAGGALNLVIEPLPHIFVLLVAVAWLAPKAVGGRLRERDGAVLAGVFLVAMGMLPGALGRADPLHVFFNGFGFLVLAFVGLRGRGAWLWAAAVGLVLLQVQATNFAIYKPMLKGLVHPVREPGFDVARVSRDTGGARVATPALFTMPLEDELALREAGLYVPDKVPGLAEVWTPADEAAKIARMRAVGWAVAPAADFTQAEGSPNASKFKRMLRLGYRYPQRRTPYVVGAMVEAELRGDWVVVDRMGDEVVWKYGGGR